MTKIPEMERRAQDLQERGDLGLSECIIAGTFVVANKGGAVWTSARGSGVRLVAVAYLQVFLAPSAQAHEFTVVYDTLAEDICGKPPRQ